MFWFRRRDVYTGYWGAEAERIKAALTAGHIEYRERRESDTPPWSVGGRRSHFGSGMSVELYNPYVISVRKGDYERAKFLMEQAVRDSRD